MLRSGGTDVRIAVETSRDHGIEIPRTFRLNGDRIEVVEVLDQWYGSDYRYCKVKGGDGALYIIRLDESRSEWHLTMFASARAQAFQRNHADGCAKP
jgi:hypothetical protein